MVRLKKFYDLWRRDNLLQQAVDKSYVMLERTNRMFAESVRSLRESDSGEIGIDIYEEDRRVNHYEQKVRRRVLKHLAITGKTNLASGLILTSIVVDIERIGDYTKNITELAVAHPKRLYGGTYKEDLRKIEDTVRILFEQIVPVLKSSDGNAARTYIEESQWIKKRCDEIDCELVRENDPNLSRGDAVTLALYVRYLKRIGAHLMNILSSVVNPFERIGYSPSGKDDT